MSSHGPVPAGWRLGSLCEIAELNPGLQLAGMDTGQTVTFLAMGDVSEDGRIIQRQERCLAEVKAGFTRFQENDVLFAKITPCMENGKGALATGLVNGIGVGSTEFHVLRAMKPGDQGFIYQVAQSPSFRQRAEMQMTGSAGQRRVPSEFFRRHWIPIPMLPERRKIARILTTVDELIERTEALIAKHEAIKKGLMQDLLTRGVDEEGRLRPRYEEAPELYKESELGWIPREWEVLGLAELTRAFLGGGTPSTSVPEYWHGSIPWITGADAEGRITWGGRQHVSERGVRASATSVVPAGNILLVTRTVVGNVSLAGVDIAISQDLTGVVPDSALVDAEYLYWQLTHRSGERSRLSQGTIIKGIPREDVESLPILTPSRLAEQHLISRVLTSIDLLLDRSRRPLSKYQSLRRGLMQDLLTGRVRVTPDPEDYDDV